MNDSSKIKLLTGTTVLLILLNVVIVGFMWFGPHPPRPDRPGGPGALIIDKLKFDDNQRKQFEELKDEHQKSIRAINDRDHKVHQALFDLIRNGQDSTSASDSLINEIAQNKKQIEAATFHHLVQLRKVCTPDQQKQFDGFVLDLFEHRQGPPPPGGRP